MLTDNQECFARAVAGGMEPAEAYRAAYPQNRWSEQAIGRAAGRLMDDSRVRERIGMLRRSEDTGVMTLQERLAWLSEVIRGEKGTTADKLKASDQMNKLQGAYGQNDEVGVVKLEDVL